MIIEFRKLGKNIMHKVFKSLTTRDYFKITIVVALICIQVFFDLKLPEYMSTITQLVETPGSKLQDIFSNGFYMLGCAIVSLVSAVIVGYIASNISATLSMRIRQRIYDKVCAFGLEEINHFSTSSLITRTTNDVTQIQMFVAMGLQLFIKAPITAVWAITKIINKSWQWSAITAVAVAILLGMVAFMMVLVVPKFKITQKLTDRLNNTVRENLIGIRVVRAFNAEAYQEDKFEDANEDLTRTQLFTQKAMALLSPMMYLVMYFLTLAIYFIGASIIDAASMSEKLTIFGDMIVFSSYAMQVIMSFLMLAMIFMIWPRASVSASRINEVLDTNIQIVEGTKTHSNTQERGTVLFKNISFKYPDAQGYVLEDVSFQVKPGQTVAFIGSTGSGKSTLLHLIPRFYDVSEGAIFVDGMDVREYTQEALQNKIGYVSQKAVLFNGSIYDNVAFGQNRLKVWKDDDVKEAIRIAQAEEFVLSKEDTYHASVAQRGQNFSGGQKQRLSIARAIAKHPEIYLFDDSFSALDYQTDARLRKELKKSMKDATVLIVAQRIGTILHADQIVVLDQGRVVGMGTHKELMKSCEVYQEIAYSQLSKEELENA